MGAIQPLIIWKYEKRKGTAMGLTWRQMTDDDKRLICNWKYEGDYAIYNYPSYEEMKRNREGFMAPGTEHNWITFLDGDERVGFVNILEEATEVFIGIGVNPSLCGRHYGRRMLETAAQISGKRYPGKPLYLEVRTWNKRAVNCYQSAGFHIEGNPYELITGIGKGVFFRMVRP